MSQACKWGTFWLLVIGVVVGILLTAATVGVVQWAGTDKFCTGWCHSMGRRNLRLETGPARPYSLRLYSRLLRLPPA